MPRARREPSRPTQDCSWFPTRAWPTLYEFTPFALTRAERLPLARPLLSGPRIEVTMSDNSWRAPVYAAVASCFFIQGGLVWADVGPNPGSTAPLSAEARHGQTLFRENGCPACHQLFGMGGFLGPDLTNVARRVAPGQLGEVLTVGRGPMPAFHLDEAEQKALMAYFTAVDATGQGTPLPPPGEGGALFAAALTRAEEPLPPEVERGAALVAERGCGGCHVGFSHDGVGRAPDLSLAVPHLGEDGVAAVLEHGRAGMPPTGLTAEERDAVVALLGWVADNRDTLAPPRVATAPWWAYPTGRDTESGVAALK